MEKRRLLISFAHPDDESFGLGAAIPKWINDGVDVYLICATNGEVGTVPQHLQGKHKTIADLRLSELECARQYLDFKDVFLLDYRDSGMTGSETSRHPDSLCYQWEHHPECVTETVATVMRQIRPQVVVTFNRYGGYGHPDHIAIQRATERAFHCLRKDDVPETLKPQKLYYAAFPTAVLWARIVTARLNGQDPRRMGINKDIDIVKVLWTTSRRPMRASRLPNTLIIGNKRVVVMPAREADASHGRRAGCGESCIASRASRGHFQCRITVASTKTISLTGCSFRCGSCIYRLISLGWLQVLGKKF